MSISASLTWLEELKFNAQVEDRKIQLNSAEQMRSAFSPMELFLISLAGCTAFDVRWILERQRQKIDRFEINITGRRRKEYPQYYESIDLEYFLKGDNIRKSAVERAIRLSQERYCSVRAMLKETVRIRVTCRISDGAKQDEKLVYRSSST